MSNRRKPAGQPEGKDWPPCCPDCDADVTVWTDDAGMHVKMLHDPWCPALKGQVPMPCQEWGREVARERAGTPGAAPVYYRRLHRGLGASL